MIAVDAASLNPLAGCKRRLRTARLAIEKRRGAADVHLVVRDHGATEPQMVVGQIHTFDACNPPTPQGEPLSCTDLQVSVHEAAN